VIYVKTKSVYKRLLGSLKKGCFSASFAVNRSVGSNLSNPCNKSISKPPEWSTCCIIKFCTNPIPTIKSISQYSEERWKDWNFHIPIWWLYPFHEVKMQSIHSNISQGCQTLDHLQFLWVNLNRLIYLAEFAAVTHWLPYHPNVKAYFHIFSSPAIGVHAINI
jgi:hypothetical protein